MPTADGQLENHIRQRRGAGGPQRRPKSETRRLTAMFSLRMTDTQRAALDEAARRAGFPNAQALVMHRVERDLAAVMDTAS